MKARRINPESRSHSSMSAPPSYTPQFIQGQLVNIPFYDELAIVLDFNPINNTYLVHRQTQMCEQTFFATELKAIKETI